MLMLKEVDRIRFKRIYSNVGVLFFFLFVLISLSYYQFWAEPFSGNFFLWFLYNFQNLYTAVLGFPIFYLIIINYQFSFSLNNYNCISRLKSRRILFLSDARVVFETTLAYMAAILLIGLLMGIFRLDFQSEWSQEITSFFENTLKAIPNKEVSLISQVGLSILFFFLYLLMVGNVFNFLFVWSKKKGISFILLFLLIASQVYFYKIPTASLLNKMMPINHSLIYLERFNETSQFISISISLFYWLFLLVMSYVLLYMLYQRTNLGE
ncbi:hypothetical protein D920_01099 [Enterococcus faecalis 13-SD-W-01]|nr:hypothetical protein D920_01099 [Enterococcus faecalis 13-SD-W-01]